MKVLKVFLLFLAVALLALVPLRNILLKRQLEKLLAGRSGFGVELGSARLGLTSATFEVDTLKLSNPADFPDSEALEVKQVRVDYDWRSLFSREVRFSEITLDVPKLVLVRKADGETNAERLGAGSKNKPHQSAPPPDEPSAPPAPAPQPAPKKETQPRAFRVDRLVLRVGTVEYRDYTRSKNGGEPAVTAMTLNMDQEYRDVTSLQQLGGLVLGQSIQQMGLFMIGQQLQDDDSKLNKKIKKAADKFQKQLGNLFGAPQEKQP